MTDKEVGELWKETYNRDQLHGAYFIARILDVIRKLVEERSEDCKWNVQNRREKRHEGDYWIKQALRDFGIDPKEYK